MNTKTKKGPVITAQTGMDEAFIIGTKDELVSFARQIIRALDEAEEDVFFGEKTRTRQLQGLTVSISEVSFDWLVVTDNEEQTQTIFYQVFNG